jgi:hypothetical protein
VLIVAVAVELVGIIAAGLLNINKTSSIINHASNEIREIRKQMRTDAGLVLLF